MTKAVGQLELGIYCLTVYFLSRQFNGLHLYISLLVYWPYMHEIVMFASQMALPSAQLEIGCHSGYTFGTGCHSADNHKLFGSSYPVGRN